MKFGIVSDTHSNYHALKAVLNHMNDVGVDKMVHLGDIVGYGPKPSETLLLTLEKFNYIVMGNHDLAVVKEEESWGFNPQAREAVDWTRGKLESDEIDILSNLRYRHIVEDDIMFAHGSPAIGKPFDYILDKYSASSAFANQLFRVAFVGHTHQPFLWGEDGSQRIRPERSIYDSTHVEISIPKDKRAIVNVGSVGQPRDGDPRASYATYDTETGSVTWYKVPYEIDRTVGLMQRAGFSSNACERLLYGR